MFESLPPERFESFHREFQGDTWDICGRCGGKCEINKIGSLMPGETEFIAASMGISAAEFRARYLDGIETPFGIVDVLKLRPRCSFLDSCFRCTIKDVKVVLCEVYPIVFDVKDEGVQFSVDDWCPIVRHVPELTRQFEELGIPALRRIGCPDDWYRAVALYDPLCVDYHRLGALRAHDTGYVTMPLSTVEASQDEAAGPPELGPPA